MGIVMTVWGVFLLWIGASGAMTRFLGPRTYWVAWFGAAGLLVAGAFTTLQAVRSRGPGARGADALGAAILLAPLLLVAALPAPRLGAQAASRKASAVGALASFVPPPRSDGRVGLEEIHYASMSLEYADSVGITDGLEVSLVGFVTHPKRASGDTFAVTRFYISCCAADAVPYSVVVDPGTSGDLPDDTWIRVEGTLARTADGFVVNASDVTQIDEPESPYLY